MRLGTADGPPSISRSALHSQQMERINLLPPAFRFDAITLIERRPLELCLKVYMISEPYGGITLANERMLQRVAPRRRIEWVRGVREVK